MLKVKTKNNEEQIVFYKNELKSLEKLSKNSLYYTEYITKKKDLETRVKYFSQNIWKKEIELKKDIKDIEVLFNALENTQNSIQNLQEINTLINKNN